MLGIRSIVCILLLAALPLSAAEAEKATTSKVEYLPGIALSQGITEITGVAISPLLGVSSVGAWRWWHTPAEHRTELPWFARPWAWGTGFALLAICFLKDSLGTAVPGVLKKPLDMVELFENKLSALVASGAFVPLIAGEMARHMEAQQAALPTAAIGLPGLAFLDLSWLMVPVSILAFLVVWICSHAINVLIILSPFSTLDALLKLARAGLLASVGIFYLIAPWFAAAFCLALIAVAAWLAPAAMRLMIFGTRYAADILLPWRGRRRATPQQPQAFTLGSMAGLPPRTGGRIILLDDGAAFRYRRWCFLDQRTIPLPEGTRHIEKGIFAPSIVHQAENSDQTRLLLLLPRYRGKEDLIVEHLRLNGTREHALARGFTALKQWLAALFRGSHANPTA